MCLATQSCPTLYDPIAHQAPRSMGILQARILEWVAMPSSMGSSQPRDQTQVFRIAGRFFTIGATMKDLNQGKLTLKYTKQSELKTLTRGSLFIFIFLILFYF